MTALLTPEELDQAAATLDPAATRTWQTLIDGYARTAPADEAARALLTKTVPELVEEALRAVPEYGQRPPIDVRLGPLARLLPDWAHPAPRVNRGLPPSIVLYAASRVLQDWGWQARPYRLRDWRGRRCLCGAICTAVALGYGSRPAADIAAGWVLTELRHRGWPHPHLIGEWNRQTGRAAEEVLDVVHAARARAAKAEQQSRSQAGSVCSDTGSR